MAWRMLSAPITVQGEKEYQLAIGEKTALGGQRYLSIGDGNVYLVDASLLDTFALGLRRTLWKKETIPSMTDLRGGQITTNAARWRWNQEDSGLHTITSIPGSGRLTGVSTALVSGPGGIPGPEHHRSDLEQLWNTSVGGRSGRYGLTKLAATVTVRCHRDSAKWETNETDEN